MNRKEQPVGPRLETLLDERDHVRVRISLAEEHSGCEAAELRRKLTELEATIAKQWGNRQAD